MNANADDAVHAKGASSEANGEHPRASDDSEKKKIVRQDAIFS